MGPRSDDALSGFTIGVTAQRRAAEFAALLQRHGAKTVHGPAIRILHLVDDVRLREVTRELIRVPPDVVVVTTGFGFRSWIDTAHAWALDDDLLATLRRVPLLARGPKALGAIRQAGLREEWSAQTESSAEVVARLVADGTAGRRIAVQLHGAGSELEPNADVCRPLSAAGAHVIAVPVYRWEQPRNLRPVDRLIAAVIDNRIDAVTFTSAPAVASLVERASTLDALPQLIDAFNGPTICACVGPVTATPLNRLGIPTIAPTRYRLGALARLLIDQLPQRATQLSSAGHQVSVRNRGVVVDGHWRPIPPTSMKLLQRLINAAGRPVPTADLATLLAHNDTRSVHTAIGRLRTFIGAPECIQTTSGRGYRLALDAATG